MQGQVNNGLEPVLALALLDNYGATVQTNFVIDTGFTGEETLPQGIIDRLRLQRSDQMELILADGTIRIVEIYIARLQWCGMAKAVNIVSMESEPLIGMALLSGSNLSIDALPGGMVTITDLSGGRHDPPVGSPSLP